MSSQKKAPGDERFLRVQRDPRFWEMPDRERKVRIDKRFRSMFHDQRFKVKSTVDKRGRPVNHSTAEDLRRFYNLSESEEEEEEKEEKGKGQEEKQTKKKVKEKLMEKGGDEGDDDEEDDDDSEEDDDDDDDDDDEEDAAEDEESLLAGGSGEDEEGGSDSDSDSGPDMARGKGNIETSSDEDDEDEVDLILRKEEEEIEHDWGDLCKDAPRGDEVSARLAVCNMDWDRMKAKDLLALFNSFTPEGGAVLSVKIYPSEFGKERLKTEETQAPMELRPLPDDSEDDNEEQSVYREKMRDYQFKRLKFFYAVVECDSTDTATKIYSECDGYEYESSCSVLDLRFVPDDVTFEEEPRDTATDMNLTTYTPKLFTSTATSTSKVEVTWDETDHDRVTAMNRNFRKEELLDMDFNAYLASSSSEEDEEEEEEKNKDKDTAGDEQTEEPVEDQEEEEEEEEEEKSQEKRSKKKQKRSEEQISKYRDLLRGIQEREKKLQEEKSMEMEITWVPGLKETTEQLVKKKLEGKDELTPWEEFLQKKKEKKKEKKKNQRQQGDGEDELSEDELPSDVDLNDPFFAEELAASDAADVKKKQKKKKKKEEEDEERTAEEEEELEKRKAEMALLMDDDGDDDKHKHFNFDKIVEQQNLSKQKKKKLLKKGGATEDDKDDFQVDVKDPRFQAMFTSHLYNLDPTHPSFKKTRGTQSILTEKQRRRQQQEEQEEQQQEEQQQEEQQQEEQQQEEQQQEVTMRKRGNDCEAAEKPMDPGLSLLVKSIKNKTQQFQARKKQKLL